MTDLTEQWKKGKLLTGYYYIICIDEFNHISIDFYNEETDDWNSVYPMRIQKVLAPVPSYDEWEALKEQNTQIKELLKECRRYIDIMYNGAKYNVLHEHSDTAYIDGKELLTKIDGVLNGRD